MLLKDLIKNVEIKNIVGNIDQIEIEDIIIDSKRKSKNSLFIAQKGTNFDGHNFLWEAYKNGAIAAITEHEIPKCEDEKSINNKKLTKTELEFPQIIVENSRRACSEIASEFYGNPKNKLTFAGITGTNGKTSVSFFLAEILKQANKKTAIIGSLGVFYEDKHFPIDLTTPDPLDLHKILAFLVESGIEYVIMEVSAHALALKKVENIKFKVGILTNISQDHLDFFKTMNAYATEKLNWFNSKNMEFGIVNADDRLSKSLRTHKNGLCTLYYGLYSPSDTFAININKMPKKTEFVVNLLDNIFPCSVNLSGEFNVYNTISAATAALCLGVGLSDVEEGLKKVKAPVGRFNVIDLGDNRTVIIDFAHTPDSLEKVLKTAREICAGKLISVFGCGGDRDRIKRPIMGKISENLADYTILTSDNPRFENPKDIINDIAKGFKNKNFKTITERKSAIAQALSKMKKDDVVVIAGKGGELYQDINGVKHIYSDFTEVEKFKKKLNKTCETPHIIL